MTRFIVLLALVAVGAPQAVSQLLITGVVNSASFQSGLPAGGGLATIFCSGSDPTGTVKPGTYLAPTSLPLPYQLGGFYVGINNTASPVLAVVVTGSGKSLNAQINFQVPIERNASLFNPPDGYPGILSTCGVLGVIPLPPQSQWGGFFADATGHAAAQHASDYSPVTLQNPAHPGETIIAYADDFFPVWPSPPVGFPAPQQPLFQLLPGVIRGAANHLYLQDYPQLDFKGRSYANTPALQMTFQGLAPGLVGVEQINFVVPVNQQPGDWALFFNIGSCPDGGDPPSRCGNFGSSSPYVKLPVR
jgi:uncharacterized protein (TIGR03437 family)